jgi:hypothetical protein
MKAFEQLCFASGSEYLNFRLHNLYLCQLRVRRYVRLIVLSAWPPTHYAEFSGALVTYNKSMARDKISQ